jgi:hypothetical protein
LPGFEGQRAFSERTARCLLACKICDIRLPFTPITRWSQDGWSDEKMLPMLTAYMGNVREKGCLRYFELTPSRYRAQLACLDVRTRASDVAGPSRKHGSPRHSLR